MPEKDYQTFKDTELVAVVSILRKMLVDNKELPVDAIETIALYFFCPCTHNLLMMNSML